VILLSFDFINDKNKKIHFIGIGGISMSGLAEIIIHNGYKVSGSDRNESSLTKHLETLGAKIFIGHASKNITDASLVVYTAAIPKDNPELKEAINKNIPLMDRAEFLGELMKNHKYGVAIAGTHGKTTTTSMMSHIVLEANVDPTILVGGNLDIINGNVRSGTSDYFITEACEYKESFLKFYPYIGVILNIDIDHLDYYRDIDHIQSAFQKFADKIPQNGYLIINADDIRCEEVSQNVKCNVISYGINNGDLKSKNIRYDNKGCGSFDVLYRGKELFNITLNVPGEHNISNALSTIAVSIALNIEENKICGGLASFGGTHRRFEHKGQYNNIIVIDDYAHHPTEIKAAIKTAKNYVKGKLYCVFQPHTYTRTIALFHEFAESFYGVDEVILADIYAAREKYTDKVSSAMLCDKINSKGVNCSNIHSFDEIVTYLSKNTNPDDLIITVGAGDVYKIGEMFLNQ
jgi:UDP-N-acetylmuramate--alanine ligase